MKSKQVHIIFDRYLFNPFMENLERNSRGMFNYPYLSHFCSTTNKTNKFGKANAKFQL